MEIRLCLVCDPIENLHSLKSSGSLVALCKPSSLKLCETFGRHLSVLIKCGFSDLSFPRLSQGLSPSWTL